MSQIRLQLRDRLIEARVRIDALVAPATGRE